MPRWFAVLGVLDAVYDDGFVAGLGDFSDDGVEITAGQLPYRVQPGFSLRQQNCRAR